MILLSVNSVKTFKHKASKISKNNVLPICEYIHIRFHDDVCVMTKTNTFSFVRDEFGAEGKGEQEYLVLEKDLFAFVDNCTGEILSLKREKGSVWLTDDTSTAIMLTTEDLFPILEVPEQEVATLSPAIITHIRTASKMLLAEETGATTWRSHVFIGKGLVAASDGFIGYGAACDIQDEIIFRKEVISSLPDIGAVYKQNSSYDFLECGTTLYGFVKSEQKFFDMSRGMVIPESEPFEIIERDLVSFNEWVMGIAQKPQFTSAEWKYKDGTLSLSGYDGFSEKSVDRKIKSTGGEYFKYAPIQMNRLLKAIDLNLLVCYRGNKSMCFTDENKSFISLIQQIV